MKLNIAALAFALAFEASAQNAPTITSQPVNAAVLSGSTAQFTVVASGTGPFTYQWRFNGALITNGVITTIAGNGSSGYAGDGGRATNAALNIPISLTVDPAGNVFFSDLSNNVIRRVDANGVITTVAGNGGQGYTGDGAVATNASLNRPVGVAISVDGRLFIADSANYCVRMVDANGIITTIAGNGTFGNSGDGGPATNAVLTNPMGLALDKSGNLFIAGYEADGLTNGDLRRIGTDGIITSPASVLVPSSGGLFGVAVDNLGNLFLADAVFGVIEAASSGDVTRFAGMVSVSHYGYPNTGYWGDGGAATNAALNYPFGLALDAAGNIFVADTYNNVIRKIDTNEIITTAVGIAYDGRYSPTNYAGDGDYGNYAYFDLPTGVAVDRSGNLFIADSGNNRIRKITYPKATLPVPNAGADDAGNYDVIVTNPFGSVTSSIASLTVWLPPAITNQPASQYATVGSNISFTVTAVGTAPMSYQWFFNGQTLNDGGRITGSVTNELSIFKVAPGDSGAYQVVITNLYGSATSTVAILNADYPPGISSQPADSAVLSGGTAQFEVTPSGTGPFTYQWQLNGTNIANPPLLGNVLSLAGVTHNDAGNYDVIVATPFGGVTSSIAVLTVLGPPFIISEPQARSVAVGGDSFLSVGAGGTVPLNFRWILNGVPLSDGGGVSGSAAGTLTISDATLAEGGYYQVVITNLYGSVTSSAARLSVGYAPGISVQPARTVVLDGGTARIMVTAAGTGPFTYQWRFNGTNIPAGVITTVAGNGTTAFSGDGGPATNAGINYPSGVAVDPAGYLYISDYYNQRIRRVDPRGNIITFAGNGDTGYSEDGIPATTASLNDCIGLWISAAGELFIADSDNSRVRKVDINGIISTVAGNGVSGFAGDGGLATNAALDRPFAEARDGPGNLFIVDDVRAHIRKVGTNGIITTITSASNGPYGFGGYSGDGGYATNALLNSPAGVAVDGVGNIFIADTFNYRVRKVGTNSIISTVAGNGVPGYSGDGGLASNATLNLPYEIVVDSGGTLYFSENDNHVIRMVTPSGIISTVAGNGTAGFSGDGGPATNAQLSHPSGLSFDPTETYLFITDAANNRVRRVNLQGPVLALYNVSTENAGVYDVIVTSPYGSVTSSIVQLTVALPDLTVVFAGTNGLELSLKGTAGQSYALEAATNLAVPTFWHPVVTNAADSAGNWSFAVTNALTLPERYYRVRLP